jgi:transcription elongation factor GreB
MSRGFVKEDDQEEAPFIPPRAALPDGVPNHVTPRGLQLLLDERTELENLRAQATGSDQDRRHAQAEADGRLALLSERIASARVQEPPKKPGKVVRFGCTVTYEHQTGRFNGQQFSFTLVGVDEAKISEGLIAFTAPLARALMGRRIGQVATLVLGKEVQKLKVVGIT